MSPLPAIRRKLRRDARTFELIVRAPHGTSVIEGYRRAARHFGFRTLQDPTTAGGDDTRILIHRDAAVLRRAARALSKGWASENESDADEAELWLATESDVHWFHHDWRYWDAQQDRGALEHLGWTRKITQIGDTYLVHLKTKRPQRAARRKR